MEEINESFCNITEKFPAMEWSYTVTVNHPVIFFFPQWKLQYQKNIKIDCNSSQLPSPFTTRGLKEQIQHGLDYLIIRHY